jgi:uncharacterized membrane protein
MTKKNEISNADALEEKILRRIPWEVLGFCFLLAASASLIFDLYTGLFVLGGGILSAIYFVWLHQALSNVLLREKKQALKASALVFILRLMLILAIFFIIIFFFSKKIIAFVTGFSSIIIVLLIEAVGAISRLKTWKN